MKIKTSKEHYEKYKELAKEISESDINQLEGFVLRHIDNGKYGKIKGNTSKEKLARLLELDPYLNNIQLRNWDAWAGFRESMGNITFFGSMIKFPKGLSASERVSLLKHLAIYKIIKAKPEFK